MVDELLEDIVEARSEVRDKISKFMEKVERRLEDNDLIPNPSHVYQQSDFKEFVVCFKLKCLTRGTWDELDKLFEGYRINMLEFEERDNVCVYFD